MKDFLAPDDTRDALRKQGGLLLALGILMLLVRKGDDMADFWLFLLLAGPAVFFYGGGVLTTADTGGLRPWQAVYSVVGLIFVPIALFQFVELVDGDTGASLNVFWILSVTAALAAYAGLKAGIRFHLLAGSIAVIIAWSALWNEILSDGIAGDFGTYRGLLGILAVLLLVDALYIWRNDPGERGSDHTALGVRGDSGLWKASEVLTGAGIAALIACGLGVTAGQDLSLFGIPTVETNAFWDILLLLVSLGLIGIASLIGVRGPAYVGAIGLVLFLVIVGGDLNEGSEADPSALGQWPIILLVLGGLGIALSGMKEASRGDEPKKLVERLRGK